MKSHKNCTLFDLVYKLGDRSQQKKYLLKNVFFVHLKKIELQV